MKEERIIRVPLGVGLIRSMDALILEESGGLRSRAEFIREAVENLVLELSYPEAPSEPTPSLPSPTRQAATSPREPLEKSSGVSPVRIRSAASKDGDQWNVLRDQLIEVSTLGALSPVAFSSTSGMVVEDRPLFGLHNRDFASLWAAHHLGGMTADSLVPIETYYRSVVDAAWKFGEKLTMLTGGSRSAVTALFPTNVEKREAAEEAFRSFALGTANRVDGVVRASGPLFQWALCGIEYSADQLMVGLTPEGHELLQDLAELALTLPQPPGLATRFLRHLARFAPGDWWGFRLILEAARDGISRSDLVGLFAEAEPNWTVNECATNTAGYVSRTREWGLLEMKQVARQYRLTEFGAQFSVGEEMAQ